MDDSNAPATKADIQVVKGDIQTVRADIQTVKGDIEIVKGDIQSVKADIQSLKVDFEGKLDSAVSKFNERHDMLRAEMQHNYDDLVERMDATETKLLQAFYSYAESNQKRVAGIESEGAVLKSRLSSLEERIIEIEKRLNMPPAA